MKIETIASARSNPVVAMTIAATMTASDPSASLSTSRKAARMLKLPSRPPANTSIAPILATRPTTPKTSMIPDATSGGANSRWMPSIRMNVPTASRIAAWRVAASTSARRYPQVRRSVGLRRASWAAISAMTRPAASVNMCPASASRARLPEMIAPMTSTTSTTEVRPSAIASRPRWSPPPPCVCECVCSPPIRPHRPRSSRRDNTELAESGEGADRAEPALEPAQSGPSRRGIGS